MSGFSDTLGISTAGLRAQAARLRVVAQNISNVDTPGYRRKLQHFETDQTHVHVGSVTHDPAPLARLHDPTHPLAGRDGFYEGSNVNLMIEVADAREAQRSYEANLKMFDQARRMSSGLFDLLRR